jgi:membrane fusion protein, copper/silver efflux system
MTPPAPNEPVSHRATDPPEARAAGGPPCAPGRALWTVVKVIEMRLRFIVLMLGTGLVFGYWDTLANRFEKWCRPSGGMYEVAGRLEYFCPMHPSVIVATPAQCPTCGMPLARRVRGVTSATPEGVLSQVHLTPGQVAQAGVRTVAVGFTRHDERLTTVGYVGFDESRRFQVASNARGHLRVDRLHAASEGVAVQAGQRLAELYGYDVSQAIQLYLDAFAARRPASEPPDGPRPVPPGDPEERIGLAAQGLKVLGVRQDQIDALTAGSPSSELLPLLAPISGHVVRKAVYEGQYVSEGTVLYEIADLSRVWVVAQVFEDELGRVEVGRRIDATVPTFPGEVFPGRVALIAPALDPVTRTAAVRFELDNPGYRLRPGMFATVTLSLAPGPRDSQGQTTCPVSGLRLGSMGRTLQVEVGGRTVVVCCDGCVPKLKSNPANYLAGPDPWSDDVVLSVPESAVIDTGSRKVVYFESGPGLFQGRAVTLGARAGDYYPVLAGLAPGERVAAAGAFLIDAESRLNPATGVAAAPGRDASEPHSQTSRRPDGTANHLRP